jgi:hypothetical protein
VIHTCTVASCGRPTQDMLCAKCVHDLTATLRKFVHGPDRVRTWTDGAGAGHTVTERTPGLVEELQITLTRQHVLSRGSEIRQKAPETALMFHQAASDAAWEVDNTIATWARDLATLNPHLTLTATTTVGAAQWMTRFPNLLAAHPAAGEMLDELASIAVKAERVIDTGPDRVFLGKCGTIIEGKRCTADLHGVQDKPWVYCRECSTKHDALERWTDLQAKVRDSLATAAEIAEASQRFFGHMVNVKTVRTWARRGVIDTCGHNRNDEPLHRVDEVLKVAATRGGLQAAA